MGKRGEEDVAAVCGRIGIFRRCDGHSGQVRHPKDGLHGGHRDPHHRRSDLCMDDGIFGGVPGCLLYTSNRFAVNVWDVDPSGKTDEQVAEEGLNAMEVWMRELGLVMKISELGATEDMLEGIADGTIILSGGYKALDHSEIAEILKESM